MEQAQSDTMIAQLLGGYTEEELKEAFEAVQDKDDWKAPIRALVAREDLPVTIKAIEHYTATSVYFDGDYGNFVGIYSVGYRMGPAGDH